MITKEGVYYTVMVYASNNASATVNVTNNISVYGDNDYEQLETMLRHGGGDAFVEVSGEIEFSNSFGYLNAEYYPLLTFYPAMILTLMGVGAIWAFLCFKHRSQLIMLHHFLSALLA